MLYFVYLFPCLRLLIIRFVFHYIFIVIAINHMISLKQLVYLGIFVKSSASECCLAFAYFFFVNFSLALLMKVLLIKRTCILKLRYWPLVFTLYKAFLKTKKRSKTSLLSSFSTWFLKKGYILVADQILLPDCLYFLRY